MDMRAAESDLKDDAQEIAEACVAELFSKDVASQELGIDVVAVAPGQVSMQMEIVERMLNGHKICHGGYIFSLADSSFALASNTGNHSSIVSGCNIDFVKPGRLGDVLTAEAKQVNQGNKIGHYDVVVTNQRGEEIAYFRGRSCRIGGPILPTNEEN